MTSDVAIDGLSAGENLASRFKASGPGVWRIDLKSGRPGGTLRVSIRDRQGNESVVVTRPLT